MAIVAADIIAYGSASMPDDDTPTGIGGAIDTAVKVVFTDISATDTVEILSSIQYSSVFSSLKPVDAFSRNGNRGVYAF